MRKWNSDEAKILVNGKAVNNCRIGFNHELDGTDLVIFVFIKETAPVKVSIAK